MKPNHFGVLLAGLIFLTFPVSAWADTTPPVVSADLTGVLGENNWYTSTVDVNLSAQDSESGVASLTYQLDSSEPVTTQFQTGENAVQNSSFEQGWFWGIKKWFRRIESGWGWFWQSGVVSYSGSHSASIINFLNGTGFWHNRNPGIWVEPGQNYSASVWVKTYIFVQDSQVTLEVWERGSGWANDSLLAVSQPLTGVNDWTELTASFVPQAGQDRVYLRLRMTAGGFLALAYFDDVSLQSSQSAEVTFNAAGNGEHLLSYWAVDGAGNESIHQQTNFKIDTSAPTGWQNFRFENGSVVDTFKGFIDVTDTASGVDVSTAQYAYYTEFENKGWDHDGNGETDWYPIAQVRRVSDGAPAGDGETGTVTLETPEVDFGESSVDRFLFRIADMSGQSSQSQVQAIEGPWVEAYRADVYGAGGIRMYLSAPAGKTNGSGLVGSGVDIDNFSSELGASIINYSESHAGAGLAGLLPDYTLLKNRAEPTPDGKTPGQDGIYLFTGDFVLDQQSKTNGFMHNTIIAVIFVEGDLRIRTDAVIDENSVVLWVVGGDLLVEGAVEDLAGVFMVGGDCDTNADRIGQNQLRLQGGLLCLGKVTLARDLGEDGVLKNSTDPAEEIIFPAKLFLSEGFAQLLSQGEREYIFRQK